MSTTSGRVAVAVVTASAAVPATPTTSMSGSLSSAAWIPSAIIW